MAPVFLIRRYLGSVFSAIVGKQLLLDFLDLRYKKDDLRILI
jgi:hypothetical protein